MDRQSVRFPQKIPVIISSIIAIYEDQGFKNILVFIIYCMKIAKWKKNIEIVIFSSSSQQTQQTL